MKDSVYKHALFVTTILGAIAAGPIVSHAQQQNNDAKTSSNNDVSAANVLSKPVVTAVNPPSTQPEPVEQQKQATQQPEATAPTVQQPVPAVTQQPEAVSPPPVSEEQVVPATPTVEVVSEQQNNPSETKPVVTEPEVVNNQSEQPEMQATTAKVNTKALKKKVAVRSVVQKKKQQVTTSKTLVKEQTASVKKTSKMLKTASTASYNNSIKDTFKDANLSKAVVGLLNEDLGSIDENTIFTEDMALYYDKVDFKEAGISNIGATRFLVKS